MKKSQGKDRGAVSDMGIAPLPFDPSQPLENERHERFCLEVLNGKALVRAYQLAFPDADYAGARASASRLLTDANIASRLAYLREEQRSRLRMSADDIRLRLEMAANFDPADLYRPDGSLIPIHELPPEIRLCIEKVEVDEITVGKGDSCKTIGRTSKIQAVSKKAALELLGRAEKMFVDRKEVKFTNLEDLLAASEKVEEGE